MIKLPVNNQWSQPNNSDKFGSIAYSKNINLDEEGYLKLSPRSVKLYGEDLNSDFGVPFAFARFGSGQYLIGTTSDATWNAEFNESEISFEENDGTGEITHNIRSHGLVWRNLWHATRDTTMFSRAVSTNASATWTSRVTGLTSGVRHYLCIFKNRNTLLITNANVVKQYNTSYANTTDLTIPADYEVIGVAYNNNRVGVITRLGSDSEGQNQESYFFTWKGDTTEAEAGFGLGSDSALAICAYKSSFAVLTRTGQLKYFNGGGFEDLASFPFYFSDKIIGSLLNLIGKGDLMTADGDVIYINLGIDLNDFGRKEEVQLPNNPSGIWCFDLKTRSLYHRYSPSISQVYFKSVTDANINTTTDIFTTSATVPATGSIARFANYNGGTAQPTGITLNYDYYVIKLSSTTFQLAETKEKALAGVYINITAKGSGGTSTFWMYDLVDYGNTYHDDMGAIGLTGEQNTLYTDVIFGGDYYDTSLTEKAGVCITVPFLENRGYFITPKIFSSQITDINQKVFLKFRPLKTDDVIIIKVKEKDVLGLPVSSPNSSTTDEALWTGDDEFYTTTDLSEAKTAFDGGIELEVEFVAGVGAGQMVKVTDISESSGTYALTLEEPVIGATSGLKSYFTIDNWRRFQTITSGSKEDAQGFSEIAFKLSSKSIQFKIELRGSDTTIEEFQLANQVDRPTK